VASDKFCAQREPSRDYKTEKRLFPLRKRGRTPNNHLRGGKRYPKGRKKIRGGLKRVMTGGGECSGMHFSPTKQNYIDREK